jgi:hypothetical protein
MNALLFLGIGFAAALTAFLICLLTGDYRDRDEIIRRDEPFTLDPAHMIQNLRDDRPSFLGGPEGGSHGPM